MLVLADVGEENDLYGRDGATWYHPYPPARSLCRTLPGILLTSKGHRHKLAARNNIRVIDDAAQALGADDPWPCCLSFAPAGIASFGT